MTKFQNFPLNFVYYCDLGYSVSFKDITCEKMSVQKWYTLKIGKIR